MALKDALEYLKSSGYTKDYPDKLWKDEKFKAYVSSQDKANQYRDRFYQIQGGENQRIVLESLKKKAERGDAQAIAQFNAIAQDERINQPAPEVNVPLNPLEKATTFGAELAKGVVSAPKQLMDSTVENLNYGTKDQATLRQAQSSLQDQNAQMIASLGKQYRDPKTTPEKKAKIEKLLKVVTGGNEALYKEATARNEQTIKNTDALRIAAAGGSVVLDLATLGTAGGAATVGAEALGKQVAKGAALGAVSGGLNAVQEKGRDVKLGDITRGAAIGGALGGTLTYGVGKVSELVGNRLGRVQAGEVTPITDESRLLPAKAGNGAKLIPENRQLTPGSIDEKLAVMSNANQADVSRLAEVEKKIAKAQKNSNITADEARGLMAERNKLISRIQHPTAHEYVTPEEVMQATTAPSAYSPSLTETAAKTAQATGGDVPMAAQRAEAAAVEANLTKGFKDLPSTPNMNLADQANKAVSLVNGDYAVAKQIAMGATQPQGDLRASAVFEAVKAKAVREKDVATLYDLATKSKVPSIGKEYGQFNAAFAVKDPEDPVVAMKTIMEARNTGKSITKDLSPAEAQKITEMAQAVGDAKNAMISGGDRLEYGRAFTEYQNYVNELKSPTTSLAQDLKPSNLARGAKNAVKHPGEALVEAGGVTKALRASMDNSAIFRQGWKTLWTNPVIWQRNARKSFVDMVRAFGSKPVMDELTADIVSRPNSVNGLYKKMKLDVLGTTEEAFPTQFPEKLPILGRFYRASEAAYTGFVQKTRADVADKMIEVAQKSGVDVTDKAQLESIGKLVNSLTGRGDLGRAEPAARVVNNLFFSPRNVKSHVDVLTAHQFQRGVTPFVRKQAAMNLAKIIGGTAAVLGTAEALKPGSVEWDPRSSNFGKIKIGNTRFDVSGGMASVVTLASRLAPTSYNGDIGLYSKNSSSGQVKSLTSGEPGSQTPLDVFLNFTEGKLAPLPAAIKDVWVGKDFSGNPVTPKSVATSLLVPLSATTYTELKKDPKAANALLGIIADGLGIGVNNYSAQKDWNQSSGKQVQAFKQKVSSDEFMKANQEYNDQINAWVERVSQDERFKKLPTNVQTQIINSKKQDITDSVMEARGFKYTPTKDKSQKQLSEDLKNL